jgi:transcriptional regulator with XRE-family HTH domain
LLIDSRIAPRTLDERRAYEEEILVGEATDTLAGLVESLGIARAELATRLNVSRGRVSQILAGGGNLTLRSLAALGWALGIRFELLPLPMADRSGTPAVSDPPAPAWLRDMHPLARLSFQRVPRELVLERSTPRRWARLRTHGGVLEAA